MGLARPVKMRRVGVGGGQAYKNEGGRSWEVAGPTRKGAVRVGVAAPVKTRAVRLRFAKTSTWVLAFTNPRVGGWLGLQKRGRRGRGWPGKDGYARVCRSEHPGARFGKPESWRVAGPTKMRAERVEVAGRGSNLPKRAPRCSISQI